MSAPIRPTDEEGPEKGSMTISTVWVVGRWPDEGRWEMQGVYSTKPRAETNSQPGWFVAPIPFNTPLPLETTEWPGLEWVEKGRQ